MKTLFVLLTLCMLQISWCKIDQTWWKHTTIYEVFLPSFKDGNGDGMGDLKGLISKLDHFVDLGIETVYITPHYESPMVDSGYDITNFVAVNPVMGTMEDFEMLIKEMKIRDLIINHSSDEHPWFIKSVNKEHPYTDYFIWKDPKGYDTNGKPTVPNNWLNVFGGSAWEWNDKRKQFYYHQFTPKQPDFNLRNKLLKTEIKKIFKFWLDKGVAGFRLDAVKHLLEDAEFRDEPVSSPDIKVPIQYQDLRHIYTQNVWDSYQFLHELRVFIERVTRKFTDFERVLISEDYVEGELLTKYYGTEKYKIVHVPLNFNLAYIIRYENANYYHNVINDYLRILPEGGTPAWNAENHDKFRKAFILNEEFEFTFASMVLTLPGMAYLYYGQEIGVTGSKIRPDQEVNKFPDDFTKVSRDYFRHPMAWDDSLNGGFTNNEKAYLPLNSNYWRVNVKSRKSEDNAGYYHMFKKIVNLRNTDTLKYGDFKSFVISTWVFAYTRKLEGRESYVMIYNLGSETEFVDLNDSIDDLPEFMTIEVASPNSGYQVGEQLPTGQQIPKILILRPYMTLILSTRSSNA
ncbi:alpha-glucosidase-like isoform X2 [Planococcus citri]|uniref:alpha-glucosidase-like isoform X2 n=1 Tax=Planococcus citri TaxID=170843 RepID=UPI0031FA4269